MKLSNVVDQAKEEEVALGKTKIANAGALQVESMRLPRDSEECQMIK